jgi:hypothetical protein
MTDLGIQPSAMLFSCLYPLFFLHFPHPYSPKYPNARVPMSKQPVATILALGLDPRACPPPPQGQSLGLDPRVTASGTQGRPQGRPADGDLPAPLQKRPGRPWRGCHHPPGRQFRNLSGQGDGELAGALDEAVMAHTRHENHSVMRSYRRRAKITADKPARLLDL